MSAPPRSAGAHAVRVALDGAVPAGHEVLLVRDDRQPFALVGRWAGGGALVGSEPVRVATPEEDPFALLGERDGPTAAAPHTFLGGGWFGYLGFGLGAPGEEPVAPPPTRERLPAFALAWYDHLLRLDPDGRWWFEALWTPEREAELTARLETLRDRLAAGVDAPRRISTGEWPAGSPPEGVDDSQPSSSQGWRAEPSPAGHARAVEACRERIAAGDLYQANLALRLRSRLDGDPADLFARGVAALRPDRAAFLAGEWGAVASLSPELFLARHGDRVRSAPIKGTRRRAADPGVAEAARAELLASEKDNAENVMIVDLVRNDLGRVCVPGSVRVRARAEARPHPGVWHLVSEVEGELRADVDDADLLRATFPPGSVTGAPKLAALSAIAELESHARQAFTGAIGFASPTAGLELNVAIRTFEISGDDIWLDVGGGIVADSDPAAEAAEALVKAAPLLKAIGAAAPAPAVHVAAAPVPLRRGPRPLPRPDPAAGVFDTILVRDGEPVALDRHLARLRASMAALYGTRPPDALEQRARAEAARAGGSCRLRLDAVPPPDAMHSPSAAALVASAASAVDATAPPGVETALVARDVDAVDATAPPGVKSALAANSGLAVAPVSVETAPLPPDRGPLTVAAVTVPGGIGAHKWIDRRLLDALAGATAPAIPLLVDLDGQVLEALFANVVIRAADGALATPPLDGRILPGVTRELFIEDARARGETVVERPVTLAELRAAPEVLITSSLRGAVPVTLVP